LRSAYLGITSCYLDIRASPYTYRVLRNPACKQSVFVIHDPCTAHAYAYYISTYAKKTVSRYDSHKKSELRKVYNEIVKINKDSPLYKIPNLTDAKKYAIDIKENARSIQNVVASLSDQYGSFEDSFKKKVAMSSDDEKVSVTYIGDGSEESKTNNFDIEVQRLATPQINQGRFLKDNTLSMRPGAYSFDLNTSGAAYEFQYNINSDETNLDVLDKLARLVNSSSLGITAEILSDGNGSSALKLTSIQTGLALLLYQGEGQSFCDKKVKTFKSGRNFYTARRAGQQS
jgi:flagellar hook-associated protein 2